MRHPRTPRPGVYAKRSVHAEEFAYVVFGRSERGATIYLGIVRADDLSFARLRACVKYGKMPEELVVKPSYATDNLTR